MKNSFIIIVIAIILISICITPFYCTDKNSATLTLKRNGYIPLKVGGYGWFQGGQGDIFITKFTAIAINGDTVTGCVTSGLFKGNTIRTNN